MIRIQTAGRVRRWAGALAVCAAAVLVVAASDAKLRVFEQGRGPAHHLLYLPNGKYLRIASLGNAPLFADLIYIWSIQYYGNYQVTDRYKYVDHVYANIITELDPHYFDPYWIGALILSVETKDLDHALALLDKGFVKNPDQWIFPYLAGWECASVKKYDCAISYFRKASAVPSAPPDIARLVAGMYQREGESATALAEWTRLERETHDPGVRKVAESRIRTLTVDRDLAAFREAIEKYRILHGRLPARLADLVREGLLAPGTGLGGPAGSPDVVYEYDAARGTVSSGSQRVLPQ